MTNEQVQTAAEAIPFSFAGGIYGFPQAHRFSVHPIPGAPEIYKQMVCHDVPGVALTIVDPVALWPDYMPEIAVQDLQAVGADALDEVVIMAVVTLSKALKKSTVNLRAPILFNPFKGLAKQVILEKQAYAVKQPLFADG